MTTISIKIEDQTYEIHTMPILDPSAYRNNSLTVETPWGADVFTCPLCGRDDDYHTFLYEEDPFYFDKEGDNKSECHHYCRDCHILYDASHVQEDRGCTDSVYYGKLIESFEYNGILYNGMPAFKSKKEAEEIIEKLLNKKYICTCEILKRQCVH